MWRAVPWVLGSIVLGVVVLAVVFALAIQWAEDEQQRMYNEVVGDDDERLGT